MSLTDDTKNDISTEPQRNVKPKGEIYGKNYVPPPIEYDSEGKIIRHYDYTEDGIRKDDDYYYNIVNPVTGRRFDIPMLSTADPYYAKSYIDYMKTREFNPDSFEAIMRWS